MATEVWAEPARRVVDRLGPGMDALWAVLFAAQTAALQLALAGPLVQEPSLSEVGSDLAEALEEVEWVRPELAAHGLAIDLAPLAWEDLGQSREALGGLLRVALDVVLAMLHDPDIGLDTADLLALSRAVTLVGQAHVGVTGRLP